MKGSQVPAHQRSESGRPDHVAITRIADRCVTESLPAEHGNSAWMTGTLEKSVRAPLQRPGTCGSFWLAVAVAVSATLSGAEVTASEPTPPSQVLRFSDGRPLAGARIAFLHAADGGLEVAGEARTDEDGRVGAGTGRFEASLLLAGSSWPPCVWDQEEPAPRIQVAGSWRIRVVTAVGGKPVEGAEVVAVPRQAAARLTGLWPGTSGTTGKNGEAMVPFTLASDLVLVRAPGFATSARGRGGLVTLERSAPLEGRLVDSEGRPLPRRIVRAAVLEGNGTSVVVSWARTEGDGGFRFGDLGENARIEYDGSSAAPVSVERRGPAARVELVASAPARLRTRFVDRDGRPVKGAELFVEQFGTDESYTISRVAVSGADGVAECGPLSATLERSRIIVDAPGERFDSQVLTQPIGAFKDLGDWTLAPVTRASGKVVDDAGRPVARASLRYPRTGETIATSDGEGRYSMNLMEGQSVSVTASARGFLDEQVLVSAASPSTIRLRRAARLRATLRLPDGSAPRAALAIKKYERGTEVPVAMRAREDGTFAFDTAPFSAKLALKVDDFEEADLGFVSITEGESRDFGLVELREGPVVHGVLVDADTGEALVGVKITAQPVRENDLFDSLDFARLPETTSGADGTFRLRGLPEGDVRLWLEAPGYAVNRRDVEVLPEGVDLGRVEVARGEPLEFVVVYPDGTPAPGIAVVIRPGGFDGYLKEADFLTDREGRFVVPRIAPGRTAVRATVGTRYVRRLVTVDGSPKLSFRLTGARVEGRVTVNGEPFPGVRVTLWYGPPGRVIATPGERSTPDGIPLPVQKLGDWPLEPPTSTDAAGRYVFAEAGEGNAWLRIEGSGWGAEGREIEVPSSGRLRVDFPLGIVELRVRLVDAAGIPVSPGRLGVYGDGGLQLASSSVDSKGVAVFYLDSTAKARYLRGAGNGTRRGFILLSEESLRDGKTVELVLDEGLGSVVVEAVDADRHASPGASIHFVNRSDGTVARGHCDREGLLVKPDLPEGRYRVVARGREGGAGEAEITVPGKGQTRITVRMEEAGKLALRVEAPPEVDPTSLHIRVVDSHGRDLAAEEEGLGRKAAPDDSGRYTLPAAPPGRYRVELSGKGVTTESVPVTIEGGGRTARVIRVR